MSETHLTNTSQSHMRIEVHFGWKFGFRLHIMYVVRSRKIQLVYFQCLFWCASICSVGYLWAHKLACESTEVNCIIQTNENYCVLFHSTAMLTVFCQWQRIVSFRPFLCPHTLWLVVFVFSSVAHASLFIILLSQAVQRCSFTASIIMCWLLLSTGQYYIFFLCSIAPRCCSGAVFLFFIISSFFLSLSILNSLLNSCWIFVQLTALVCFLQTQTYFDAYWELHTNALIVFGV